MRRTLFKSKIHRATLTGTELEYEGSIALDRDLVDAADLRPWEKVVVHVDEQNRPLEPRTGAGAAAGRPAG